jgi:hypothetical protein
MYPDSAYGVLRLQQARGRNLDRANVLNLINIFSLTVNDERQIRDELFGVHR